MSFICLILGLCPFSVSLLGSYVEAVLIKHQQLSPFSGTSYKFGFIFYLTI